MIKTNEKYYALYKGDKFIDLGSMLYLCKKYNFRRQTLMFYKTPAYLKRIEKGYKKKLILIEIEDDEEDVEN